MPASFGESDREYKRYAIYFVPPSGALADFGASWLGWDCNLGRTRPHPQIQGLPKPVTELTETPRHYGFHATLKPPFRMMDRFDIDMLSLALKTLASGLAPVYLDGLAVSRLGRFVALTPVGEVAELNRLAALTVEALDPFRAPITQSELMRRRAAGLTQAQDLLLLKWGYPFVMEEFRFHITLSGALGEREAETLQRVLMPHLQKLIPGRFAIDALTLVGESEDGRFHVIQRYPLGQQPAQT